MISSKSIPSTIYLLKYTQFKFTSIPINIHTLTQLYTHKLLSIILVLFQLSLWYTNLINVSKLKTQNSKNKENKEIASCFPGYPTLWMVFATSVVSLKLFILSKWIVAPLQFWPEQPTHSFPILNGTKCSLLTYYLLQLWYWTISVLYKLRSLLPYFYCNCSVLASILIERKYSRSLKYPLSVLLLPNW